MICAITKKRAFKTHEAALIRGGEILTNESNRRHTPMYFTAYHCDFCGLFHLSGKKAMRQPYDSFKR